MSSQVPSSNISFSDLRTKWSNKSFGFRSDPGTTNISLGSFRKATLVDSSNDISTIPDSGEISLSEFKDKSFNIKITTDQFRVYTTYSANQSNLTGTTGTRSDGMTTESNTRAQLTSGQSSSSSLRYPIILFSPRSSSSDELGLFVNRGTLDTDDQKRIVDEATIWIKAKSHSSYNQVQFGIIKKDYNLSWSSMLTHLSNKHATYADRLGFHGQGSFNYSGSDNTIEPNDTRSLGDSYSSFLSNTFHHIIGHTAGTQLSSNASSTPGTNYFLYTVNNNNYTSHRKDNSTLPYHGFKIKYYETTINVSLSKDNNIITPSNSASTWSNSELANIFSGMHITAANTIYSTDGVYISEIYNNYMLMRKQKGVNTFTDYKGPITTSNITLTVSGYVYWTLVTSTPSDFSSDVKSIGPPHTILPLYHGNPDSTTHYDTEEWAFYIGDTTSSTSNTFSYDIMEKEPTGSAFNYSVTYSSGTIPSNIDNSKGYFVVIYSQLSYNFRGDYQIDNIKVTSSSKSKSVTDSNGSNGNFDFENNTHGFTHFKLNVSGKSTITKSEWDDITNSVTSNVGTTTKGWLSIPTTAHSGTSSTNGGWQRYTTTPPSSSTGIYMGDHLYTETSYGVTNNGSTHAYTRILRSPELTVPTDANLQFEWQDAAYGSGMGRRSFFWINSDATNITQIFTDDSQYSIKTTRQYTSVDTNFNSFS